MFLSRIHISQTRKLFKVCAMRHIPVFTFINKMDREARDIFDLLDEIEKELGIPTCPVNWPIGSGKQFAGVYDRTSQKIDLFEDTMKGTKMGTMKEIALDDPEISNYVTDEAKAVLEEEIELLDGASAEFDQELVDAGELSPVFFGSALMNFGVENFLNYFLKMTSSPLPRTSDQGVIDPIEEKDFSAFVFKIQANMNKSHRDRIAFMRICSGEFEAGMDAFHVQGDKKVRLSQPQQMMASERKMIDKALSLIHILKHCILAHHGELEYGSPKKPALIEALALNFADNTDAKMETFIEALAEESRQSGEWKGYNKLFETNIRPTSHLGEKD